jgi:hypothetical protein
VGWPITVVAAAAPPRADRMIPKLRACAGVQRRALIDSTTPVNVLVRYVVEIWPVRRRALLWTPIAVAQSASIVIWAARAGA